MALKAASEKSKDFSFISDTGIKVRLRPLKTADGKQSVRWRNDPEIRDNLISNPFPVTLEMEHDWIENVLRDKSNRRIIYAIETVFQHHLIGFIYLTEIDWISRVAWFGIMIGEKDYQGQGMGKEAMKLLFDYAFNRLNLRKVSLEVATFNHIAINLYKSMGFKEEGRLKRQLFMNNEYFDISIMSLFKEQFV